MSILSHKKAIIITALAIVVIGAITFTSIKVYTGHHKNNPAKVITLTTTNHPQVAGATTAPTPTPTPTTATHVTPANAKAISNQVVAAMPKISIPVVQVVPFPTASPSPTTLPYPTNTPMPTPTPNPRQYNPEVEAWYYSYAAGIFNDIYNLFLDMGVQAENNNLLGIQHDCGTELYDAYALQYYKPDVPDASMNQTLNTYSNALMTNADKCQDGINKGDVDETVNAINGMEYAILGLIALEQQMVPTN